MSAVSQHDSFFWFVHLVFGVCPHDRRVACGRAFRKLRDHSFEDFVQIRGDISRSAGDLSFVEGVQFRIHATPKHNVVFAGMG